MSEYEIKSTTQLKKDYKLAKKFSYLYAKLNRKSL